MPRPYPPSAYLARRPLGALFGWGLLGWSLVVCGANVASAQAPPTRPPVLAIEDLLGDDYKLSKRARLELTQIGARAVPAILEARQRPSLARVRREALDLALSEIVNVLTKTIGEGLEARPQSGPASGALGGLTGVVDPAPPYQVELTLEDLGDLGSISGEQPSEAYPTWVRGQAALAALELLGPAVSHPMLRFPPVREAGLARVLLATAGRIYAAERALALQALEPKAREAFRTRYRGLCDLATPVVAAGMRDADAQVRGLFQAVRDEALEGALSDLDSAVPDERLHAEEVLFRLGTLAQIHLQAVAAGRDSKRTSAQSIAAAKRLLRRIRFGLTRALVIRLGQDLEGYEDLSFRERRATVFEIERLGGAESIPCLRALLRIEPSLEVKLAAAMGLLRQRDPAGANWFRRHGSDLPQLGLTKRELAAIHVDQGLRHLTHARFARAVREFQRALDNEESNEIAWYNLACTYSRWSKVDKALEALAKAIESGFDDTKHMGNDTDLDNIRRDPRYRAMINKILEARGEPPLGTDEDEDGDGDGDELPDAPPEPPEDVPGEDL
ncbi:MAG: hypothetical protein JKY65_10460 [Planctomycetes bacterium]|nr:hypothetical protein [Planctomycetota bacterium]